ncbi:MAG: TIGR04100 family radical SAM protein [Oscillospiraceae bacterium]|nr:TIGR04100 family radical SAM protein [Oscillospiraceae bacterium]
MLTMLYTVGNKIYVNLTNRCPCACTFCIRQNGDGAYGSDSLWLEREPTVDEVIAEFGKYDISKYTEVVFCGYGEPMERADDVAFIGRYVKENLGLPVRLNTNGLGDKINGKPTAEMLEGAVDIVSISLNQCDKEKYNAVTRPKWEDGFDAMISFAADCKKFVPKVMFTVVDVIPPEDISRCKALAMSLGIELRVRPYDS